MAWRAFSNRAVLGSGCFSLSVTIHRLRLWRLSDVRSGMESPSLHAAHSRHQTRARSRSVIPGRNRWRSEGTPKLCNTHARLSSMCSPLEIVTPTFLRSTGYSVSAFASSAMISGGQDARFILVSSNHYSLRAQWSRKNFLIDGYDLTGNSSAVQGKVTGTLARRGCQSYIIAA